MVCTQGTHIETPVMLIGIVCKLHTPLCAYPKKCIFMMKSSQSLKKIDGSKICLPVAFIPLSRTQTNIYNLQPLHLLLGLKGKYLLV